MRLKNAAPPTLSAVLFYYDAIATMGELERSAFNWYLQFGQVVGEA